MAECPATINVRGYRERQREISMDRNEFIRVLRASLAGEVSAQIVEENIRYYYEYISEEIARGRREEEVMEMLGSPQLIARTIIDTADSEGFRRHSQVYPENSEGHQRGFHAEENPNGGVDIRYGRLKLNTWYGKALTIAVLVLTMALIFTIVGGILSFLMPILIPALVILLVIRMFTGRR